MLPDKLKQTISDFTLGERDYSRNGWLFSRLVYLWFFLLGAACFPILESSIGPESLTFRTPAQPTLIKNIIHRLTYQPQDYLIVYGVFMVSNVLAFFSLGGIVVRFFVWLTALMIAMSSYMVFNAGIMLAYNFAFLLIFYFPAKNFNWKIVSSNFSYLALRIQFLLVYIFACIYKWGESDWVEGTSIHFLSLTDHFTPDWLESILQSSPLLMTSLNYVILFYMTLFPVLIWFKRPRKILLAIGMGFHVYTMVIMKLWDFGAIMLIGFVLFMKPMDFMHRQWCFPFCGNAKDLFSRKEIL